MAILMPWEGPAEEELRAMLQGPGSLLFRTVYFTGEVRSRYCLLAIGKTEFGQKSKEDGPRQRKGGSWDSPSSFKKAASFCFSSRRQERWRPRTTVGCLDWMDRENIRGCELASISLFGKAIHLARAPKYTNPVCFLLNCYFSRLFGVPHAKI